MDQLNLLHREALQELSEEQKSLLPDNIKTKLSSIDQMVEDFTSSGANDSELKLKIESASAKLWHHIKDFVEKDLPDDEDEDGEETPPPPPAPDLEDEDGRIRLFGRHKE